MSRTRIVKGTYTKISAKGHSMYSKENIFTSAGKEVREEGVDTGIFLKLPLSPPVAEINILADAIVYFRPKKNWEGKNYGIDWMRIKDTKLFGDKKKYVDIVGTYDKYPSSDPSAVFAKSATLYEELKKEYSNPVYKIPWLLEDSKPVDYFASWLCIEKNKEEKLSLHVKIKDKKVLPTDFVLAYDKTVCEITSSLGKGKEDEKLDPSKNTFYTKIIIKKDDDYKLENEITVKVLADITATQTIKVLCDGKDAGFLKLYPNNVKKLSVVCVRVKANIGLGDKTGNAKGKTELENYLLQSLVKIKIEDTLLQITKNSDNTDNTDLKLPSITDGAGINISGNIRGQSLYDYLDDKLKQEFPNLKPDGTIDGTGKYDKYLRLYFLEETAFLVANGVTLGVGGIGTPIGGARGTMFRGITDADVAHEAMHAIALGHSFGTNSNISTITPYLFEYKKTENVMDYAHLDGNDKYSTWKWQWDKLRNFNLLTD